MRMVIKTSTTFLNTVHRQTLDTLSSCFTSNWKQAFETAGTLRCS